MGFQAPEISQIIKKPREGLRRINSRPLVEAIMKLILWMILCVVLPTSANATFIQWELGEEIAVASLCRDQKSIIELARADQVNEEAALKAFASLASRGLCVVFDQHRSFTVVKKLFKY